MAMCCYYKISLEGKRMKHSPGIYPFGLQNMKGATATPNKLLMTRALSNLLREGFVTENQMMSLSESGWNGMSSHSFCRPTSLLFSRRAINHSTLPFGRKN